MIGKWMVGMAAAGILAAQAGAAEAPALKTEAEKVSYIIGVDMSRNMKRQGVDIHVDPFAQGMRDALADAPLKMTDEDIQKTMQAFQEKMMRKQQEMAKASSEAGDLRKKEGEAFLAENGKKEGVVSLPSGLQYKVIAMGEGPKPTDGSSVECHYRGTLIDGKEFDSSYKRGRPATFPVNGVIAGWTEALKLMPVGSKWQLFIPAQLGYGARGAGADIGPNETLIFEIELLGIK